MKYKEADKPNLEYQIDILRESNRNLKLENIKLMMQKEEIKKELKEFNKIIKLTLKK